MAQELDVLLARVADPALRADLKRQIDRVRAKQQFGLVFESHLPETVRLPSHPVRRGSVVGMRDSAEGVWVVQRVSRREATITRDAEGESVVPVSDLVVVADFGDPIYPGLKPVGSINRGEDRAAQLVINGENFHVLEALQFTHLGRVDCIYIDPPYNSGARDWKYDNDYVDKDDGYRHSKWLAFMDRRLRLAKLLLDPEDSVLIVTIDEKEYLRLGLLLTQVFPDAKQQMVSSVINPAGTGRQNEFSRTNEYIFVLQIGDAVIQPMAAATDAAVPVEWEPFRRRDLSSVRRTRPRQFYPVYVDRESNRIVGTGDPLPHDQDRHTAPGRPGCASVFPVREDGTEMNWALTAETFLQRLESGYARVGRHQPDGPQEYVISYLRTGPIADIESGRATILGRNPDGSVIAKYPHGKKRMPVTQWDFASHDAQRYGTTLLQAFIPGRRFPFPKSLYAVEDVIRIAVGDKPHATVLDFFGGSGTTLHAVARLNHEDGGSRKCILVTNNEVSANEARTLRDAGHRPGDPEWEALGIFEHITRPRVTAAITGETPDGEPVEGDYKFTDVFPMSEGFRENVEFFELTYLDAEDVALDLAFEGVAPLMWLRAGGVGPIIDSCVDASGRRRPYAYSDRYAVLFNTDRWSPFIAKLPPTVQLVFIVTDSGTVFATIAGELPGGVEAVRLYENYLTTFSINER